MSCLKLGSLIHRRPQNPTHKPAPRKKGHHDSEPSNVDRTLPPAPKGRQPLHPLHRTKARHFDLNPTPAGPGETPTPLPPRPAPAPAGIPSVGNDAPDAIDYPTAAPASADETAATSLGRSWCCCCPGGTSEEQGVIV